MEKVGPPAGGHAGLHIVVVDDEMDIIEGLKGVLELGFPGAKVTGCYSPLNALEVLRRERVDVLWTDYRMPELDGIQLVAEARRLQPGLRPVLFTAADNVRALASAHGLPVLPKTVGAPAIVERVRDLVAIAPVAREHREARHGVGS